MKEGYGNNFEIIIKYFFLTIVLFISAVNFNLFIRPINFVTGGIPGLSIIVEHLFDIPINYFMYFIYFIMFILCLFILGKKSIIGVLYATIFYPTFVLITSDIIKYIIIDYNDIFLICICSGIISGICNGFIYKLDFPSSGLGVLGPIFNKCFNVPIASTNFVINTIIVFIGGYFFDSEMILYAIIFLYLNSFISNKIILGISSNKAIFIRSNKLEEINNHLLKKYKIEAILLNVLGGYTNQDGFMSMIVVPTTKYNMIINDLKIIDCNIFYNVLDSYELSSKINNNVVYLRD